MKHQTVLAALLAIFWLYPAAPADAASCDAIASLALTNAKVTTAVEVAAGAFTPPGAQAGGGPARAFTTLPAFCRVAATLTPSSDSDIKIEVWLPVSGWNGKFQAVGNGAWQGSIAYPAMAGALQRGYATSSTDTGHVGGSASFGLDHPEKVIDFAYRSEHEMTVSAKSIVNAFYGSAPKYSYWVGCSAGGRQAMKEAQMFPADFDGIIAGAPGLDWSGRSGAGHRCRARAAERRGTAVAGKSEGAARRGRRRVRLTRRRQGWPDREPGCLQVRSGRGRVQGCHRVGMPDPGASRHSAVDLLAHRGRENQTRDSRPGPGKRARLDRHGLVGVGSRDRTRSLQVPRLQGPRVGGAEFQHRHRRGST